MSKGVGIIAGKRPSFRLNVGSVSGLLLACILSYLFYSLMHFIHVSLDRLTRYGRVGASTNRHAVNNP